MNYIVIQAVTLVLALLVFRLVLCRTTLHRFNRVVLLSVIILSFVLPLVHVTIPQKQSDVILAPITEYVAEPVEYIMPEYIEVVPVENTPSPTVAPAPARHINWSRIASVIWLAGAVFFLLRLLMGIVRAEIISRRNPRTLANGTRLVLSDLDCQPSSWRRTIIMSRRDYEDNGPQIIAHEQAHIRCRHSIDVVVASLCCAVQWFNPASWMLKHSLKQIHEYEADDTVLRNGYDSRRYQSCLIRAALQQRFSFVTSNFADCSTKKRINMMNRYQSSPWARISVLLMLPVALFAILLASACKQKSSASVETVSQEAAVTEEPVLTPEVQSILSSGNYSKPDEWFDDFFEGEFMKVMINSQDRIYVNTGRVKRVIDSTDEIGIILKVTWGEQDEDYSDVKACLEFDRNSSEEVILQTLNEMKKYVRRDNICIPEPKKFGADGVRRPSFVLKRYPDYLPEPEGEIKIHELFPERNLVNSPLYTRPFDTALLKDGENKAGILYFIANSVLEEGTARVYSEDHVQPAIIRAAADGAVEISNSIQEIIPDGTYTIQNVPTEREPYLVELTSAQGQKYRVSCHMMFSKALPDIMHIYIFDMETALSRGTKVPPPPPVGPVQKIEVLEIVDINKDTATGFNSARYDGEDARYIADSLYVEDENGIPVAMIEGEALEECAKNIPGAKVEEDGSIVLPNGKRIKAIMLKKNPTGTTISFVDDENESTDR